MKKLLIVMSIIIVWSFPTSIHAQDQNSVTHLKDVLLVKLDSLAKLESGLYPKQYKTIHKTIEKAAEYADLSLEYIKNGDEKNHIKTGQKAFNLYRKAKEQYKDILYTAKFTETPNFE